MTLYVIPALDCPRSVKSAVESHPISKWSEATYAGIFSGRDVGLQASQ